MFFALDVLIAAYAKLGFGVVERDDKMITFQHKTSGEQLIMFHTFYISDHGEYVNQEMVVLDAGVWDKQLAEQLSDILNELVEELPEIVPPK